MPASKFPPGSVRAAVAEAVIYEVDSCWRSFLPSKLQDAYIPGASESHGLYAGADVIAFYDMRYRYRRLPVFLRPQAD